MQDKKKDNILISIIMNCYNGENYLQESLNSIINQSYKNWELIFWDNMSSDNSANIIKKKKMIVELNIFLLINSRNYTKLEIWL